MSKEQLKEHMAIAEDASFNSNDPSTKVGAYIRCLHGAGEAIGWNHVPEKFEPTEEKLADRSWKYARVVHAEADALSNLRPWETNGATLYSTVFPCAACALQIAQYGIAEVVSKKPTRELLTRWGESFNSSLSILKEAGIKITYLDA